MITDIILCMFIDLDQISSTATFLCDPDLDFFHSRSINNFGRPLRLSLFSVTLISTDSIPCMGIDLDDISLTATFPCDPDLDFSCSRSLNIFTCR